MAHHGALRTLGVHPDRVQVLHEGAPRSEGPVVYWMEASHRSRANAALAHALAIGAELRRPVAVVVAVAPTGHGATARAATFELQGLRDVRDALAERGIGFALATGRPSDVALAAARHAAVLVTDRSYLRAPRAARAHVAAEAVCPVVQVEADAIVPVDVASGKAEVAARTLRPKLHRVLDDYLADVPDAHALVPWSPALELVPPGSDVTAALDDVPALVQRLDVAHEVESVDALHLGGERTAAARLGAFTNGPLAGYAADRGQPHRGSVSYLGMYLRYGHISPVRVLAAVREAADHPGVLDADRASFVEELLVRRELALNFVERTEAYDRFDGLPTWARRTLAAHADDPRPARYDDATLLAAATDDPYWNAAMRQSVATGYQHNHMRMYWGKKVLEWSDRPEQAYERLVAWNDRFHLDGGAPNSYAGVGWVFGLHDRPWFERPVFGMVRYMNANGLRRKTDPDAYVRTVGEQVAVLAAARP